MNRILKIGMDVHSTSYTLCAMEPVLGGEDRIFANIQVTSDYRNVIQFIDKLKEKLGFRLLFHRVRLRSWMPRLLTLSPADQSRSQMHDSGTDNDADTARKTGQNR